MNPSNQKKQQSSFPLQGQSLFGNQVPQQSGFSFPPQQFVQQNSMGFAPQQTQ